MPPPEKESGPGLGTEATETQDANHSKDNTPDQSTPLLDGAFRESRDHCRESPTPPFTGGGMAMLDERRHLLP
jgi:hypothetical protein